MYVYIYIYICIYIYIYRERERERERMRDTPTHISSREYTSPGGPAEAARKPDQSTHVCNIILLLLYI